MPWYSKEQPTPFDSQPIPGMTNLHGDLMARRYNQEWLRGQKYPIIHFPSELERELVEAQDEQGQPILHVFGAMRLPRRASRDEAFAEALRIAEEYEEYRVLGVNDDLLVVANVFAKRGYSLRYDNRSREIVDVQLGWRTDEMMDLLPGELRAALPRLYANEALGMQAIAPIKYFTPDAGWTWYPTEFDGTDTFFGLVSGFDVELGYFSLSELESVRGGLRLPVERDLYYKPTTLAELKSQHQGRWDTLADSASDGDDDVPF